MLSFAMAGECDLPANVNECSSSQGKGPMLRIRKVGEQRFEVTEDQQGDSITSEAEFERWLIAALEWERQRLQQGEGSRSLAGTGQH
jgi:hypothetical protein